MASTGNTFGILVPQPSPTAGVSNNSANPPEPLTNAAGPVDVIEAVADVASTAVSLIAPGSTAEIAAEVASTAISLISMVPGLPGPKPPAKTTVNGFTGGFGMGFDGGVVTKGKKKKIKKGKAERHLPNGVSLVKLPPYSLAPLMPFSASKCCPEKPISPSTPHCP